MLKHISVKTINEVAALADAALGADDLLLNKSRPDAPNRDSHGMERLAEPMPDRLTDSLAPLDASLDDAPLARLKARLGKLGDDERFELMAVMLIGRGEFGPNQWDDAVREAQNRSWADDVDRISEKLPLHDDLKKGLYELKLA